MLAPSVPRDWTTINRETTTQLWSWAPKADNDTLVLIRRTAATRRDAKAKALVEYCDQKLGGPPGLPLFPELTPLQPLKPLSDASWTRDAPPRPWYKRRAFYVVSAILGAVGMGVGHGAGEQLWHMIWPALTQLVGL